MDKADLEERLAGAAPARTVVSSPSFDESVLVELFPGLGRALSSSMGLLEPTDSGALLGSAGEFSP